MQTELNRLSARPWSMRTPMPSLSASSRKRSSNCGSCSRLRASMLKKVGLKTKELLPYVCGISVDKLTNISLNSRNMAENSFRFVGRKGQKVLGLGLKVNI